MKIKTKKRLSLPQLIEWAWENDVTNKNLLSDNNVTPLRINTGGEFIFDNDYVYSKNYTFTVTSEEEITEVTVFENLIEIYETPEGMKFSIAYRNASINYVENDHYLKTLAIHILNDDLTMTLIWTREKGLVE